VSMICGPESKIEKFTTESDKIANSPLAPGKGGSSGVRLASALLLAASQGLCSTAPRVSALLQGACEE
jgi:hypothetical protein